MVDNLSRWLRAVRPETDADGDGWSATPAADALLAAVQRTIAPTGQANGAARAGTRRRALARGAAGRRMLLPAGALAAAAAVALALAWTGGTPPPAGRGTTGALAPAPGGVPRLPAIRAAALLLSNYSSCPELLAGLRSHTAATVGPYGLPSQPSPFTFGVQGANALASAASMGPGTPTADTSSTNVQEPGVDEPDIVKTDGGRLITLTDGVLRVVDDASRVVTGSLDLTMYAGWQNAQLLVDGDHALVILGGLAGNVGYGVMTPAYGSAPRAMTALSTYLFVDLAGAPQVTGSLRASGSYLAARLIGSTVRLVVHSGPSINLPVYAGSDAKSLAANRAVVRRAPLSAWLPQYSLTQGAATTNHTVPCQQVSHPAAYTGASLLTIYTLDLTHLGAAPNPVSVAADGDTVYATSTSLYLASNPDWSCCPGPGSTSPAQQTEIHRFDITGSSPPTYLGSGSVPGRLLSQYSLSDYAGSLRIATTSGDFGSPSQSSGVYVLNADTLTVTGHVGGLGKGEQIYAVRFIGALAYVVTFRQTDPLYVIDLHDPAAPKLVGSLQLDGYSAYLHDAGNGRLIGVGQQTSATGQVAGLQVSLFDVSAPAKPMRTARVVLANTPGESTLDPHAFLYWPPTGLVVVPIQTWTPTQAGKVLVLKLAGATLSRVGVLANPLATGALDDGLGIQRSLIVDGALWTVSGSGVQVSNPSTLTRQSWIPFG